MTSLQVATLAGWYTVLSHYSIFVIYSQVHGEVTDPDVDIFDREKVFIETILAPLVQRLPRLKVVMEHITTIDAVRFIESYNEGVFSCSILLSTFWF